MRILHEAEQKTPGLLNKTLLQKRKKKLEKNGMRLLHIKELKIPAELKAPMTEEAAEKEEIDIVTNKMESKTFCNRNQCST